jgi:hypothetical protein
MGRFLCGASWGAVLACVVPGSATAQVELAGGGVTLRAPAALDCAALPVIAMDGAIAAALAGDRAALADVVGRMSQGIASACPTAEALRFEGTERGVTIGFRTEKAQGWQMPGAAAAAAPAPAPAAPAATAAAPATDPAPAPPVAEAVPIAPGLAFADLAAFFGPLPAVNGHFALDSARQGEVWARIMAARAYAERPELLNDDETAFMLAAHMLTEPEFAQFLGPVAAQLGSQGQLRYITGGYQGISVFDRRDIGNRIRTQLKPYLDQRRQTGPIPVYGAFQVTLGEYDFATGSFPIASVRNPVEGQELGWMGYVLRGVLDGVVHPERLQTSEAEARQLDAFLRDRRDNTLYLGVFLTLDPRAPASVTGQTRVPVPTPARVASAVLYADAGLTQPIFDYTTALAPAHAAAEALAQTLAQPMTTGEALLAAIAARNGTQAALPAMIEAVYLPDPAMKAQFGPALTTALSAPPPERIRLRLRADLMQTGDPGNPVELRAYGPSEIMLATLGQMLGGNVQVAPLPLAGDILDEATRAEVQRRASLPVELLVDAVLEAGRAVGNPGYLDLQATLRPLRVTAISGAPNTRLADRRVLAVVDMPEGPVVPSVVVPAVVVAPQGN